MRMRSPTLVERWPNAWAMLSYRALSLVFLGPLSLDPLNRVRDLGESIAFCHIPIENVSRFLNENYLGYVLAFLAMGYFTWDSQISDLSRTQANGD